MVYFWFVILQGFSKLVPKFTPQTPQAELRKTAYDRRSSFSGRKAAAVGSGNLSTELVSLNYNQIKYNQPHKLN